MVIQMSNTRIILPIEIDHDSDYKTKLKEAFEEYKKWISEKYLIDLRASCEYSGLPFSQYENLLSEIISIEENIEKALEYYYCAKISDAVKTMYHLIKELLYEDNLNFLVSDIDESYATRLIAPFPFLQTSFINNAADCKKYYYNMKTASLSFFRARIDAVEDHTEMSHIPFNKRDSIGTQRFSVPGTPCLYMGASSYDIWKELGQPPLDKFNVSAIRLKSKGNRDEVKILNLINNIYLQEGLLSLPKNTPQSHNSIKLSTLVTKMWPLVCATSFHVNNSMGYFHSEYIISHLIMWCLPLLNIDGIAYVSKQIKAREQFQAHPLFVNIAIPMVSCSSKNELGPLCSAFEITDPVNFQEILALDLTRSGEIEGNCYFAKVFSADMTNKLSKDLTYANKFHYYRDTAFFNLDNYLCGLTYHPMSIKQENL